MKKEGIECSGWKNAKGGEDNEEKKNIDKSRKLGGRRHLNSRAGLKIVMIADQ